MSTTYNGQAANVTMPASLSISNSTFATPIVILTTTPHGRATGDTVDVFGHQVNTAANGQWVITVLDATHFSLNGSVGIAGGLATGTVVPLAFASAVTEPSDGDASNAASVDTPFQAEADRGTALLVATGAYKLTGLFKVNNHDFTAIGTSFGTITVATGSWTASTMGYEITVQDVQVGDVVEVDVACNVTGSTSGKLYALSLFASNVVPNHTPSPVRVPASGQEWANNALTAIHMKAWIPITTTGTLQIAIYGIGNNNGDTITFFDDEVYVVKVWRPTNFNQ